MLGADGKYIPVTDLQRLPDHGDMRVWLARVPAGAQLRWPPTVAVAVLPGRTRLQLGFAAGEPAEPRLPFPRTAE